MLTASVSMQFFESVIVIFIGYGIARILDCFGVPAILLRLFRN